MIMLYLLPFTGTICGSQVPLPKSLFTSTSAESPGPVCATLRLPQSSWYRTPLTMKEIAGNGCAVRLVGLSFTGTGTLISWPGSPMPAIAGAHCGRSVAVGAQMRWTRNFHGLRYGLFPQYICLRMTETTPR